MFSFELFQRARWGELYSYLMHGDPPILYRLMIVNAVFLLIFVTRRLKERKAMRPGVAYFTQGLLIAANFGIMFQDDLMSMVNWSRLTMVM